MRQTDHDPPRRRPRRMIGGLIGAALLTMGALGAGTALAEDHAPPGVATPEPEIFQPNEVRGNPWICIDRGYQYGFTVAQNIPNSQQNSQVTTPVVKNGKNVLGKDTPENANHFVTLTSTDGVNFSWETNFDVGAVIVKGSDAYNQYTYAPPGTGVQGDAGPLTTPAKNGTFPKINQVTLCWGTPVEPPPLASLTVSKTVDGAPANDPAVFTFNLAEDDNVDPSLWTNFDFPLTDGQTSTTYAIAALKDNVLQEVLSEMPEGYAFRSLSCDLYLSYEDFLSGADPVANPGNSAQINGNVATINVDEGDHVHCIYVNEKLPTIQVAKLVAGEGAPAATFALQVNDNAAVDLASGQSSGVYIVPVGANAVSEDLTNLPANFALTGISCPGVEAEVNVEAGSASMNLAAGQNAVCTFTNTYTAPPPPPPPPGETTGTPEVPPAVVTQVRNPRLAIVKTGPARARPLDRITYTVRVRNPGRAVARNVVVTDWLPSGMTFVKASRRATVKGRTIIIPMGNLRPGQSRVVRITVRASANVRGRKINLAVARASNVRPVRDTAPTVFRPLVRRVVPQVTG